MLEGLSSTAKGDAQKPGSQPEQDNHKGWLYNDVEAPLWDAAVVAPCSALSGAVKLVTGKDVTLAKPLQFDESHNALGWAAQTAASATQIWAYVAAGKLLGAGSRYLADAAPETGLLANVGAEDGAVASLARNDRVMQVLGAGAYDFAKNPQPGQSRLRNAVGTMVTFGGFEFGNSLLSKSLPLEAALPARFAIGAGASIAGSEVSNPTTNLDVLGKTALSGGLMNALLPPLQAKVGQASDAMSNAIGRGVRVDKYIANQGWSDNPELSRLSRLSPSSRIVERSGQGTYVDTTGNKVFLDRTATPTAKQAGLAEELQHRVDVKLGTFEPQFQNAADLISSNPEAARARFLETRRAQESSGQNAGLRAIGDPAAQAAPSSAVQDAFHEGKFADEADQFIASGGQFRPEIQYNGGGGHGGAGRGGGVDSFHSDVTTTTGMTSKIPTYDSTTDTHTLKSEVDGVEQDFRIFDTNETVSGIQHQFNSARSEETIARANAYREHGDLWNGVEYFRDGKQTDYGLADRIERVDDKVTPRVVRYHIKQGIDGGADTGSTFEVYPDGAPTQDHQTVSTIERLENGTVVYGKSNGLRGWDLAEEDYLDRPEGVATKFDERSDGSKWFQYTDGSTMDELAEPIALRDGAGNVIANVSSIFRHPDGGVDYLTTDGGNIYLRRGAQPEVTVSDNDTMYTRDVKWPMYEDYTSPEYPQGKAMGSGSTPRIDHYPDYTRLYGPSYVDDTYSTPVQRSFNGNQYQITSTRQLGDMAVDYTSNGSQFVRYLEPRANVTDPGVESTRETIRGQARGEFIDQNGNLTFDTVGAGSPQPGQEISETYPQGLTTTVSGSLQGRITNVVRTPDQYSYITDKNERIDVPMGSGSNLFLTHPDGSVTQLDANAVTEVYPQGRETPFGTARSSSVNSDGSITHSIVNSTLADVREFVQPRMIDERITQQPLMYAQHFKNGMYRLVFADGSEAPLTSQQYQAFVGN